MILIQPLEKDDPHKIVQAFYEQKWHKPAQKYERYWQESQTGSRAVLVAKVGTAKSPASLLKESFTNTLPKFKNS